MFPSRSAKVLPMFEGAQRQHGVAVDALIDNAREGDAGAFEQLYRLFVGRVYALCLRMSGQSDLAEELTQSVFVRVWEKLGTFRGDSAFTTWLHRVTANVVLETHRADTRRSKRIAVTDDPVVLNGEAATPPAGIAMDLEAAIAQLPDGARQVFVLYQVEGYRHEEVAKMMGIAVGTSKAQLHRARCLLREILRDDV